MRGTINAGAYAATVALASIVLAACSASTPPAASLVPSAPGQGAQIERGVLPKTPAALLRAQADGALAGPVPRRVLASQLALPGQRPHPVIPPRKGTIVGIWTAMTSYDYVFGTSTSGKAVITSIDTASQSSPGYYPVGVKVDHSRNLWVANQYDAAYSAPITQEFSDAGAFQAAYVGGCSVPVSQCRIFRRIRLRFGRERNDGVSIRYDRVPRDL